MIKNLGLRIRTWVTTMMRNGVLGRGFRVAMVVGPILTLINQGPILTLINQGDILIYGDVTPTVLGKIALTFCVPFCVSVYAGAQALGNSAE